MNDAPTSRPDEDACRAAARTHGVDMRHVLAAAPGIAYLDAAGLCGVAGIVAVRSVGYGPSYAMALLDRVRDGLVTLEGQVPDARGVAAWLRREDMKPLEPERPHRSDRFSLGRKETGFPNRYRAAREREEAVRLATLLPHAGTSPEEGAAPDGWGRADLVRRAVARASVPEPMRAAMAACLDHGVPRSARRLPGHREATGSTCWEALAFAARHPCVADIVLDPSHVRAFPRQADPMAMLLSRHRGMGRARLGAIERSGRAIARITAGGSVCTPLAVLDVLAEIPVEWFPREGEWHAFATVAVAAKAVTGRLSTGGIAPLLDRTGGRWADCAGRVLRVLGPQAVPYDLRSVEVACRDAHDATRRLADTVMWPLLLRRPCEHYPRHAAQDAAKALLYGGKGIVGVLETSGRWHARTGAIQSAAETTAGLEWPPLFEGAYRHADAEVSCVRDKASLREEGANGPDRDGIPGLDHCVATRLHVLRSGRSHLLSVRLRNPDGTAVRLSTCQVRAEQTDGGGVRLEVEEHRGAGNGPPPPEACLAVARLATALYDGVPRSRGGVDVVPESLAPRAVPDDPVRAACGYDWRDGDAMARAVSAWESLLPRWARGLGPDGLDAALVARGLLPPPDAPRLAA